jgi:RimJ/RimL family protein N-acetyltransferase
MEKHELASVSEKLSRRFIAKDDELKLFLWRNNQNVRLFSRSTELIEREAHAKWFNARILDINKQPLFIFDLGQKSIGMTRLDCRSEVEHHYEISVLVDESFQNQGFATAMISQTLIFAKEELSATEITAVIHLKNIQSIRLFGGLHFQKKNRILDEFEEYGIYL